MNNEIVLNEDEIDGITSSLSNSYKNVSSTGEAINPNFSGAVNAGLLGNSIGIVSNQMSSISNTISNAQSLIDEYKNQLLTYDSNMALKIDDIEMPKDFMANNSSKVNMFTQSLLSKMDGKSVNAGSTISDDYDEFESTIVDMKLSDISSAAINTQELDSSSVIEKDDIGNINKASSAEVESYDDNSSIEEDFMLIDMIPRDIMDDFYYDDSSSVKEEVISDISNDNQLEDISKYDFVDEEIDYYMNKLREKA